MDEADWRDAAVSECCVGSEVGAPTPALSGASLGWGTPGWDHPEPWALLAWLGAHGFWLPVLGAPREPWRDWLPKICWVVFVVLFLLTST